MSFHDVANREWKELVPGVRIRSFWGQQMLVCHVHLTENAVVPMHQHPHEQSGVVISGQITFTVAGESRTLQPGDSYTIPGNTDHAATAVTDTTLFEIFVPVREAYKY